MNQHRGGVTAQIGKRKERDDPTSSLPSFFFNNATTTNRNKTNNHIVKGKTGKPSTIILNNMTPLIPTWRQNNIKNNKSNNPSAEPVPFFPSSNPTKTIFSPSSPTKTNSGGFLLAGYMAHEFLTKGTLFGRKYDPPRTGSGILPLSPGPKYDPPRTGSGILPLSPGLVGGEPKKMKSAATVNMNCADVKVENNGTYAEVASLLKGNGGVYIPGIVNPTQLARWIQM